jgi:hypothetical protein
MVTAVKNTTQTSEGITPRWFPMPVHPMLIGSWYTPKRVLALPCGRRSYKTETAKRRLVRYLQVTIPGCRRPRYAFAGPTEGQARSIAWQDFLDLIPDHWIDGGKWGRNVSHSRLEIFTRFGSLLQVVGLDKPKRIEGKYLNGVVIDEACDQKPGSFERTIYPMLEDYNGWAWIIGVPKRQGTGAPWYREFCEKIAKKEYPDAWLFNWPASDFLSPSAIKRAQETLDPKDYAEQYDARWQTAGGGIFHAYDSQFNMRPCSYDPKAAILVGQDFNVDPMCWVLAHRRGDRLEVFDELFIRDCNTQKALDVLWGRYPNHQGGWRFYGDAAGQQRHTNSNLTDFAAVNNDPRFAKAGRTLHFLAANPAVQDRYSATNLLLCNAAGERRCFIDDRCKHLRRDLESASYKPGTSEPQGGGDALHMTDGLGYIVWREFPPRFEGYGTGEVITMGAR